MAATSTWVVVVKGGVAYRNTPKYTDRVTTFRGPEYGLEVEVFGDARTGVDEGVTWVETKKGWIPIRTLEGTEVIKRKEDLSKREKAEILRAQEEDDDEDDDGVVKKRDLWVNTLENEVSEARNSRR